MREWRVAPSPFPAGALDGVWLSVAQTGGSRPPQGRHGVGGTGSGAQHADLDRLARVEALVALAQAGDVEAFGRIYEMHVDQVFRYVYVRVASRALAEDITSETFVRALRRLDSFSWQGRGIVAWFVTIARNLITDHLKSSRFRLEIPTSELVDLAGADVGRGPEEVALATVRDQRLVEAMKRLRPEHAECLVLRFLQELSVVETAEVLGRSEGAVKQLQLRASRALVALMDGAP